MRILLLRSCRSACFFLEPAMNPGLLDCLVGMFTFPVMIHTVANYRLIDQPKRKKQIGLHCLCSNFTFVTFIPYQHWASKVAKMSQIQSSKVVLNNTLD
jgi:hypothetical protein